jgi:hypothetical protein
VGISLQGYIIFKKAVRGGGNNICTFSQKWGRLFVLQDFCANIDKIEEFVEHF